MKKEKIIFIISLVMMLLATSISVYATSCLYNSSDVSYTAPSGSGLSANVQDSLTEVYGHCTDYTSIDTRVSSLEGHFQNSPNGYFDGDWVKVKPSTQGGFEIKSSSNTNATQLYRGSNGRTYLLSYDSTGTWGNWGPLDIQGDPVTINGTNIDEKYVKYIIINGGSSYDSPESIQAIKNAYNSLSNGAYFGELRTGNMGAIIIFKSGGYGTVVRFSYSTGVASIKSLSIYNGTWGNWVSIH